MKVKVIVILVTLLTNQMKTDLINNKQMIQKHLGNQLQDRLIQYQAIGLILIILTAIEL